MSGSLVRAACVLSKHKVLRSVSAQHLSVGTGRTDTYLHSCAVNASKYLVLSVGARRRGPEILLLRVSTAPEAPPPATGLEAPQLLDCDSQSTVAYNHV